MQLREEEKEHRSLKKFDFVVNNWQKNPYMLEMYSSELEENKEYEKAETEVQIPDIGKKADFRLENDGSKAELVEKIEEIMGRLKGQV